MQILHLDIIQPKTENTYRVVIVVLVIGMKDKMYFNMLLTEATGHERIKQL